MEDDRLREAIFERFTSSHATWQSLANKHEVSVSKLRTAFRNWVSNALESQPQHPSDIHLVRVSPGRPCSVARRHELILADAVRYFANNNIPLTKQGVMDLVKDYVDMLPTSEQCKMNFRENRPSKRYVNYFMHRNGLAYHAVRQIEDKPVEEMTPEIVSEHMARVQAAMDRYNIRDPKFVFNMDQSGASFHKMVGRALRKGVASKGEPTVQKTIRTKGVLNRVTIMPVVSASGTSYKPVVVFRVNLHIIARLMAHSRLCTAFS